LHIPNPYLEMCRGVGRQKKKKRIRNNMDEAEAGPAVAMCYKCHNTSHTYKRCTTPNYACNTPTTANVGSSTP
jgi:cytochrome c553